MLVPEYTVAQICYDTFTNQAEGIRTHFQTDLQNKFTGILLGWTCVVHLHSSKLTLWKQGSTEQLLFAITPTKFIFLECTVEICMEELCQITDALYTILYK